MYQKQASRTGTINYNPQILWDVITYTCPSCLLLPHKSLILTVSPETHFCITGSLHRRSVLLRRSIGKFFLCEQGVVRDQNTWIKSGNCSIYLNDSLYNEFKVVEWRNISFLAVLKLTSIGFVEHSPTNARTNKRWLPGPSLICQNSLRNIMYHFLTSLHQKCTVLLEGQYFVAHVFSKQAYAFRCNFIFR